MNELEKAETAKRTGGPKSEDGKAASALNAIKHGIRSKTILPSERDAYETHFQALKESLQPQGYLEERLSERVSLTLWRLRRLELWEAAMLSEQQRRAQEQNLHRRNTLDAVLNTLGRRRQLSCEPVDSLELGETLQELERLAYDRPHQILKDWPLYAADAQGRLAAGAALEAFYNPKEGSSGEQPRISAKTLKALPEEARHQLGRVLKTQLDEWEVSAEDACRAILGKACRPEDIGGWETDDWEWEAGEMPSLWRFYREQHQLHGDVTTTPHLSAYRAGGELKRQAERLLALGDRARLLLAEAGAGALMLSDHEAQKLQRYEAHLERVLYRALHELEAMQERRSGGQAPLARLEVHG